MFPCGQSNQAVVLMKSQTLASQDFPAEVSHSCLFEKVFAQGSLLQRINRATMAKNSRKIFFFIYLYCDLILALCNKNNSIVAKSYLKPRNRHLRLYGFAGDQGFEPRYSPPKGDVLPLDESPIRSGFWNIFFKFLLPAADLYQISLFLASGRVENDSVSSIVHGEYRFVYVCLSALCSANLRCGLSVMPT